MTRRMGKSVCKNCHDTETFHELIRSMLPVTHGGFCAKYEPLTEAWKIELDD